MKPKDPILPLLLVATLLVAAGCRRAQQTAKPPANSAAPADQLSGAVGGTVTTGETFHFRGEIAGKLHIEMTLNRDRERLSGTYFYPKIGKDIEVKGTIDKDGNLTLKEFDSSGKETGAFKGRWDPDAAAPSELRLARIEGKWSKPDGSKETPFSVTEQPSQFSGPQRIVPKAIAETNKKLHYSIDAEYPQVEGGDPRFDKFNKEARNVVTKEVTEWKTGETAAPSEAGADLPTDMPDSDLSLGYEIRFATDDLIAIEFNEGAYSRGAAHPNSFTLVLNYDVKNGKKLALADLFKPKSNYLSAISSYCVKDLKKQSKANDSMLTDDSIQNGAAPRTENYKAWAITRQGLLIRFDPYQVGPYAAGPQSVLVPYSALKDVIRADGPVGGLVK